MQLSYRGVKYDYNPANPVSAEYPQAGVDLKFRGASYRRGEVAKVERLGAIFKYRGASYSHQPIADVEATVPAVAPVVEAAAPAAISVEDKARLLTYGHSQAVRNRHHVMLSRTAKELGFSGNLANYWNQVQGEIDSALWADYDRSHVALS
ncbi:hypothetical protein OsccyDRAFT_0986 [Leptolyngbyaceae cyanobacterium JSC-12]|nr:hypothetical protein OsccyDRAFT_0986 [Leptolyngbyaceae cyanobacterium JSC-12]